MGISEDVLRQVNVLTAELIEAGLCNEQNFPILKKGGASGDEVTFSSSMDLSFTLKNIPYGDVYAELRRSKSFNICMMDGGILQVQYLILNNVIRRHRLAFFPSPSLEEYQNNPVIYENDDIYADIIMKNVVTSPVRFDFDRDAFIEEDHPMSHLTIGQYKNCRVPVGGPLSPYMFFHFILRSFYNTGFRKCSDSITKFRHDLETTITQKEREHIHLMISNLS